MFILNKSINKLVILSKFMEVQFDLNNGVLLILVKIIIFSLFI